MVVDEENEDVRGAKTQSLYRDVNERVKDVNAHFNAAVPLGEWLCECADTACDPRRVMTPDDSRTSARAASGSRSPRTMVYPNRERC